MKINTIKCLKCNEVIISYYRHNYKTCNCGESFIDGGTNYTRYNIDKSELIQQYIKDIVILNRNLFTWGKNYDENGDRLLLSKEETKAWCKTDIGLLHKKMFPKSWSDYNRGIQLLAKPTEYSLLKDLTSSHICGILSYFNDSAFKTIEEFEKIGESNCFNINKQWLIYHEIFTQELNFRIKNNII